MLPSLIVDQRRELFVVEALLLESVVLTVAASVNMGLYVSTIHLQNLAHFASHTRVTSRISTSFIQLCSKLHLASCFQPYRLIDSEPIMTW